MVERHIAIYGTDHGKPNRYELGIDSDNPNDRKALNNAIKHPPKSSFPRYPQLPIILGTWETQTIQVDFDNASIVEVKYWARRACYWHNLGGYVILKSSKRHFHVVFNRLVDWSLNMKVLCWIALESGNLNLQKYAIMQGIKQTSTLRVSGKGSKNPPEVVYRYGSQNKQIAKFLANRKFILDFIEGKRECFGHMDNLVTGNCGACSKETREECYEKSFGDYLPNVKESNSEVT